MVKIGYEPLLQWCMDRITKPANITTHFLSVLLEKSYKTTNLFSKTITMSLLTVFHTFLFTIFQAWMYNIHHHPLIDYYLRAVGRSENPLGEQVVI